MPLLCPRRSTAQPLPRGSDSILAVLQCLLLWGQLAVQSLRLLPGFKPRMPLAHTPQHSVRGPAASALHPPAGNPVSSYFSSLLLLSQKHLGFQEVSSVFSHTALALQFLPRAHTGPRAFSLKDHYLPLQTGSLRKMPGMAVF